MDLMGYIALSALGETFMNPGEILGQMSDS